MFVSSVNICLFLKEFMNLRFLLVPVILMAHFMIFIVLLHSHEGGNLFNTFANFNVRTINP